MKYFVTSRISENIHTTPEGYLLCLNVPIARTGEQLYADGETPLETGDDGTVSVHRHEKVVFNPKTIASFEGKPITITHPADFVSPSNWGRLAKGVMKNVRRGEGENADDLVADLLITDEIAIGLVKNGLREVSCGYECDYEQLGDGEGRQLNIRGNHLALVEKGRAGSGYAIRDHETVKNPKGETMKKTLKERILAHFAKAQDEAMAMADEEGEKAPAKKDDDAKDAAGLDELVKMVKDLGEKVAAMKPKDEAPEKKEKKDDDAKADDEGEEAEASEKESSVDDRLKALEAAVAKILEAIDDGEGEEEEESESDEEEESEDSDEEEGSVVGDTASRIEILVPGFKAKGKDASAQALKAFAATKEGKKVMDSLTGGKKMTFDSADRVSHMFIAASEIVKSQRASDFGKTKSGRATDDAGMPAGPMTAERMNAINSKHYGK